MRHARKLTSTHTHWQLKERTFLISIQVFGLLQPCRLCGCVHKTSFSSEGCPNPHFIQSTGCLKWTFRWVRRWFIRLTGTVWENATISIQVNEQTTHLSRVYPFKFIQTWDTIVLQVVILLLFSFLIIIIITTLWQPCVRLSHTLVYSLSL